jgi:hypothetical protein
VRKCFVQALDPFSNSLNFFYPFPANGKKLGLTTTWIVDANSNKKLNRVSSFDAKSEKRRKTNNRQNIVNGEKFDGNKKNNYHGVLNREYEG